MKQPLRPRTGSSRRQGFLLGLASLGVVLGLAAVSPAQGAPPRVAPGYELSEWHRALPGTAITAITPDPVAGLIVATDLGEIWRLEDRDRDGTAETFVPLWLGAGLRTPTLGLLVFQGQLYVSHLGTVSRLTDTDGDRIPDRNDTLLSALPNGWHQNNQLWTDGSRIFFGLGSVTDHDVEPDPRSATVCSIRPDGTGFRVEATGLRNVYDALWHPGLGRVVLGDNGPNLVPGVPSPRDEIHVMLPGGDHGHPRDWGFGPTPAGVVPPTLALPPHESPTGFVLSRPELLSGCVGDVLFTTFTGGIYDLARLSLADDGAGGVIASLEELVGNLPGAIDVTVDQRGEVFIATYYDGVIRRFRPQHAVAMQTSAPLRIGTRVTVEVFAAGAPGAESWPAASERLSALPLQLAPGMAVHLDLTSPIFALSLQAGNGIFDLGFPMVLDAAGYGRGTLNVPLLPALVGFPLHLQTSVWSAGVPVGASPPLRLTVTR